MSDYFVQGPIRIKPLGGSLRADLGYAGDVVDTVAHQRQVVDDALRRHAVLGDHAVAVELGVVHGVDQGDVLRDELRHVLVAGGDDGPSSHARGLGRQRADDVVGLDVGNAQQRHAHGFDDLEDGRNLHPKIVRHARPVGLVVGIEIVAEGLAADVEDHRHRAALEVVGELAQHADDAADRAGRESVEGAQIRQRVERPEQVRRAVDQQ